MSILEISRNSPIFGPSPLPSSITIDAPSFSGPVIKTEIHVGRIMESFLGGFANQIELELQFNIRKMTEFLFIQPDPIVRFTQMFSLLRIVTDGIFV
jgi:hypothetical protein